MDRGRMLRRMVERTDPWDLLIIGGGATGLGCAIDAATRGHQVLLLEGSDFAKGTSSRSTKLAHGGVRYLQQGNVGLVLEALRERGLMRRNAPHLVHDQPFIVPNYDWWEAPFYGVGLRIYDIMAGRLGFGRSRNLSRAATLEHIPTIETTGLRGGVIYYDGQFDDARLAIHLVMTAADHGATLLNHMRVTGLVKRDGVIVGATVLDEETGQAHTPQARVVINATGVWGDEIRRMDDAQAATMIAPSQGTHIVLDASFLPGDSAIMVPRTDDGRVLFAIPWHGRVIVGTTDVGVEQTPLEPHPLEQEVEFLLKHAARYLTRDPSRSDVLSVFAGLRPLVRPQGDAHATKALSRDHTIHITTSGLVTVAGGKWTTYRKMAEDTIDQAAALAGLEDRACVTRELPIHGAGEIGREAGALDVYGSDAAEIRALIEEHPEWGQTIHPRLPYVWAQVVFAVRREMARTVDDVLSRRTRALILDAAVAIELAREVSVLMARELGWDEARQQRERDAFIEIAKGYQLK